MIAFVIVDHFSDGLISDSKIWMVSGYCECKQRAEFFCAMNKSHACGFLYNSTCKIQYLLNSKCIQQIAEKRLRDCHWHRFFSTPFSNKLKRNFLFHPKIASHTQFRIHKQYSNESNESYFSIYSTKNGKKFFPFPSTRFLNLIYN